jgi:hypothetical protein
MNRWMIQIINRLTLKEIMDYYYYFYSSALPNFKYMHMSIRLKKKDVAVRAMCLTVSDRGDLASVANNHKECGGQSQSQSHATAHSQSVSQSACLDVEPLLVLTTRCSLPSDGNCRIFVGRPRD